VQNRTPGVYVVGLGVWVVVWVCGGGVVGGMDWAPATTPGAENPVQSKPYNLNPKPRTLDPNPHVI
jgi:hypothetical protein